MQFTRLQDNLRKELADIDRLKIEIIRAEADHKKTKVAFEEADKKLKELQNKKIRMDQEINKLHMEVDKLQRGLDELRHRGGSSLRL